MNRSKQYNQKNKNKNTHSAFDKPEEKFESITAEEDDDSPNDSTFSFGFSKPAPTITPPIEKSKKFSGMVFNDVPKIFEPTDPIIDNRRNTGTATKGMTPEINNEKLTIKRGYQFRESTIRKLNLLKANHPDINVYLNTIIDTAVNYYYDYITKHGGKQ